MRDLNSPIRMKKIGVGVAKASVFSFKMHLLSRYFATVNFCGIYLQ